MFICHSQITRIPTLLQLGVGNPSGAETGIFQSKYINTLQYQAISSHGIISINQVTVFLEEEFLQTALSEFLVKKRYYIQKHFRFLIKKIQDQNGKASSLLASNSSAGHNWHKVQSHPPLSKLNHIKDV